jgi:sporulation protein YlmC with PRC-barrel domain
MIKTLLMSAAISGLMLSGALTQANNGGRGDAPKADAPKFVASQSADQWVFSKFKGTDVIDPNNESIGSVNDLLFDKSGKIVGMIVGVGGFLGIGQKSVAMDMSAFQAVPASTGPAVTTTASEDPTNVKLKVAWTKDQLMQAPDFQYYKSPATTTGLGGQRSAPTPAPGAKGPVGGSGVPAPARP